MFSKQTIGTKLFAAFLGMCVIIGGMGLYGYLLLQRTGQIVVETYDGPLMSVNYGRAAGLHFERMEKLLLQQRISPASEQARFERLLDEHHDVFMSDLDIALDRSLALNEQDLIAELREQAARWNDLRLSLKGAPDAGLDVLGWEISENLDLLVEYNVGNSFVERRRSLDAIDGFLIKSGLIAVGALLMAVLVAWTLRRQIVRPLRQAARVADHLARGEFETPVPSSRSNDETAVLLRSMKIMRDEIGRMIDREKAHRHSAENRLFDALESSDEGVVLLDKNDDIVLANSQMSKFFPKASGEFVQGARFNVALDAMLLTFTNRPQLDADTLSSWELLRTGENEHELVDGRWISVIANETHEGGVILLFADMTSVKRREQELRYAKQDAETASAAKSSFLANMSHELRTPLNAIIGFSEIISGEIFGKIGHAQYAEYASDIEESGKRLLSVVNNVLDIAQADSAGSGFSGVPVDFDDLLLSCADVAEEECRAGDLTFECGDVPRDLVVEGDAGRLKRVVQNIFSNAVKFTEPGGSVSLQVEVSSQSVLFTVKDTGIGMTPEDVKIALTPFGQADGRLQRKYEGAGLGLPLVNSFVRMHRGSVSIESALGEGTAVRVSLPLHQVSSVPSADQVA